MHKTRTLLAVAALLAFPLASCGDAEEPSNEGNAGGSETRTGAFARVTPPRTAPCWPRSATRARLTVSTDPAYPPQSSLNEETGEYEGFDIDVATEIADRLGLEVAWEAPAWDTITAGSWNGRWDMSVGSMTPTNERQEVLDFTEPYYYTPAVMVVHEDNTASTI